MNSPNESSAIIRILIINVTVYDSSVCIGRKKYLGFKNSAIISNL